MSKKLAAIELKLDLILQKLSGMGHQLIKDPPTQKDSNYCIQEAAIYLKLSPSRLYTLIYEKKLNPLQRKKRGRIVFTKESLDNYLLSK